jgi:hypothetical protein
LPIDEDRLKATSEETENDSRACNTNRDVAMLPLISPIEVPNATLKSDACAITPMYQLKPVEQVRKESECRLATFNTWKRKDDDSFLLSFSVICVMVELIYSSCHRLRRIRRQFVDGI